MESWEKSLGNIVGKPISDVIGFISEEFGIPVFQVTKICFLDGTSLWVEGEHDIAYIPVDGDLLTEEKLDELLEKEEEEDEE